MSDDKRAYNPYSPWPTLETWQTTSTYYCGHCGMVHDAVCPRIAAIEYYENGTVKRIEYKQEPPK